MPVEEEKKGKGNGKGAVEKALPKPTEACVLEFHADRNAWAGGGRGPAGDGGRPLRRRS